MSRIQPFKINIPQSDIDRLKQKLSTAILPAGIEGAGWDYGSPLQDITKLVAYWRDEFDWRKAEAELNRMPQFMTQIKIEGFEAVDLHFVHVKSQRANAIPLLFCHGWPGSFDEVAKMLPLLTEGGEGYPAFDVVAPSMPNYGFSSAVKQKGWYTRCTAEVMHKLMTEVLEYPEYVTQGGDVGYFVTRWMGFLHPESCKASHFNFCIPQEPSEEEFPELAKKYKSTERTQAELEGFKRTEWFKTEGIGYNNEHSTKPVTLSYSLTDSPVGLLAWIYEKLHDWTDNYPWTQYEVCKWISIYWFGTAGPAAPTYVYYEGRHTSDPDQKTITQGYIKDIPIGFTKFPKELFVFPALWHETLGNVVFLKEYDSGGHFAAFERPMELASDLREFYGRKGGAAGVIKGRSGYAEQ